jgi:hypothetical protein
MAVSVRIGANSPEVMAEFIEIFPRDYAEIVRLSPTTASLESPRFEEFDRNGSIYDEVGDLISRLNALLHLFAPFWERHLWIDQVSRPSSSDKQILFHVKDPSGLGELRRADTTGITLCGRILRSAESDGDLNTALSLLRLPRIGWPEIYNVIEFLESYARIPFGDAASGGWITKRQLDLHARTANFYRHPGDKGLKLPPEPPSLGEAQVVILGLLRRWITERCA